jgi:hypothetical protein
MEEADRADCDTWDQSPMRSQRENESLSKMPGLQEQVSPGSVLGGGEIQATPLQRITSALKSTGGAGCADGGLVSVTRVSLPRRVHLRMVDIMHTQHLSCLHFQLQHYMKRSYDCCCCIASAARVARFSAGKHHEGVDLRPSGSALPAARQRRSSRAAAAPALQEEEEELDDDNGADNAKVTVPGCGGAQACVTDDVRTRRDRTDILQYPLPSNDKCCDE